MSQTIPEPDRLRAIRDAADRLVNALRDAERMPSPIVRFRIPEVALIQLTVEQQTLFRSGQATIRLDRFGAYTIAVYAVWELERALNPCAHPFGSPDRSNAPGRMDGWVEACSCAQGLQALRQGLNELMRLFGLEGLAIAPEGWRIEIARTMFDGLFQVSLVEPTTAATSDPVNPPVAVVPLTWPPELPGRVIEGLALGVELLGRVLERGSGP
jgi:hypothetical protein